MIHSLFCINFNIQSEYMYIFVEGSFINKKPGQFFLWEYTSSGPDKAESVLSLGSPGDSGQLYEQCLQCSFIDWVGPLVAKCASAAESQDNVIHPRWKSGPSVSLLKLASPIITVLCPNICPQWKLASTIFSPPVQLYIGQESHLHFHCCTSRL